MDMIEEYEERKRLRRSRFRWRIAAVVAILAVAALLYAQQKPPIGPHIARLSVDGVITDDRAQQKALERIASDDTIEALILEIDSPGGTVVGSEILYDEIRRVAADKPVVAVLRTVAASGGYMAAIAADHVVARGNTITGSVGVIAQIPNASELLERVGVEVLEVKSGPLKAQPSPFNPVDAAALNAQKDMVTESFDWFLGLVEERRGLDAAALGEIEAGGIFTGRQALEIGLIDTIGGEREAVAWLEAERDITEDRPIRNYGQPEEEGVFGGLLPLFGLTDAGKTLLSPGLLALYR
jgi:protease-4